jgi:hypothetical protein
MSQRERTDNPINKRNKREQQRMGGGGAKKKEHYWLTKRTVQSAMRVHC